MKPTKMFIEELENRPSTEALFAGNKRNLMVTTMALGEEGGDIYTTMAVGEEGGACYRGKRNSF